MKELSRLCSRLQRLGVFVVVTRRSHEPYLIRVRHSTNDDWTIERQAHSLEECRHFLLSLFR